MTNNRRTPLDTLLAQVRACTLCEDTLASGARPVLQAAAEAKILIAGQAPGARVHKSGIPFQDASGDRLRTWMGVEADTFYDAHKIAILPMGFCYPGKGSSGDLPPDIRCAKTWRQALLDELPSIELALVIGQYAQRWYWPGHKGVTDTVRSWRTLGPSAIPLPHPSPRNVAWFKNNPWFENELIPELQKRIATLLAG